MNHRAEEDAERRAVSPAKKNAPTAATMIDSNTWPRPAAPSPDDGVQFGAPRQAFQRPSIAEGA